MLSKFREPVSGLTHLGGAIAAVMGQIALLAVGWSGAAKIVSLLVYGLSMISLFSASAAYHLLKASPAIVESLRKLDHSAIYLLISGDIYTFLYSGIQRLFSMGLAGNHLDICPGWDHSQDILCKGSTLVKCNHLCGNGMAGVSTRQDRYLQYCP